MQNAGTAMNLRVEYTYDPESRNWCFVVPSLHIIGSGDTREEAERRAIDAVLFTLEDDTDVDDDVTGVGYLRVTVEPYSKGDPHEPGVSLVRPEHG